MSYNFVANFPYSSPRQIQSETLEILQANWANYDVFVIGAPTAFGKTAVARTLMNTLRSVSVITPTNLLVNQFIQEFPDTPTLHRADSYYCAEWKRPCIVTKARMKSYCRGCTCSKDVATAIFQRGPGVYNYHTYLARKLFRDTLVVDEAHNLLPVIKDRLAERLWQHDLKYPTTMYTPEQTLRWIAGLHEKKQKTKKIMALKEAVSYEVPEYIMQRTTDWFNGKGTTRGEPEERDCIKLLPVDISEAVPMFWPREVKKLVLLSATIGRKDVEALGLSRRRVLYINCKSPIPAANRPIIIEPIVSVNRQYIQDGNMTHLAEYIQNVAQYHEGEKGMIHVTYQLARLLQPYLTNPRFLFHDKENKGSVYRQFRAASPGSGKVLIGCGLYEGIDLPEDAGRWQIIAKVPWTSLANPAVKHLADLDPDWFMWETWKVLVQASGRICRTPTDQGTTYIPDRTFLRLWKESGHMAPEWWADALTSFSRDNLE